MNSVEVKALVKDMISCVDHVTDEGNPEGSGYFYPAKYVLSTRDRTRLLAGQFLSWVLDKHGKPKKEYLDWAYEDDTLVSGKSVFLYIDYDCYGKLRTYAGFIGRDGSFTGETSCSGYSEGKVTKLIERLVKNETLKKMSLDVFCELCKYRDEDDSHLYYGIHYGAETNDRDQIVESDWEYTKDCKQVSVEKALREIVENLSFEGLFKALIPVDNYYYVERNKQSEIA